MRSKCGKSSPQPIPIAFNSSFYRSPSVDTNLSGDSNKNNPLNKKINLHETPTPNVSKKNVS